jgi:hypothetical protein
MRKQQGAAATAVNSNPILFGMLKRANVPTRAADDLVAAEYERAAEYNAEHGKLPPLLSGRVLTHINLDPQAFQSRVSAYRYAAEMAKLDAESEMDGAPAWINATTCE